MMHPLKKPFIPLIRYFGKKKMDRKFSREPILIGGCARSGTTLLQSILSAHPSIFVFPDEIAAFNHWKIQTSGERIPVRIDKLYRETLRHRIPSRVTRWCSKAPSNVSHIGDIMQFYNNKVKFIHIIRDIRDVVLSKHPKKKEQYWVTPERWLNDVGKGLKYKDHPNVLTIKYEDLILHPETTIKAICSFIGENNCQEIHNWRTHTKIKKSKALFGEIKPLHNKSIGKWKEFADKEQVDQLMDNKDIRQTMEVCGYI